MRLTLHIGMPRSGGAEIQKYLHAQGSQLNPLKRSEDIATLLLLGRTAASEAIYRSRFGEPMSDQIEKFKEDVSNCGLDHVVWSNTFLFDIADEAFVGNLCVELEDLFDEMRVIVYLQHQTLDFPQLISQRVTAGMVDWDQIRTVPEQLYNFERSCKMWDQDIDLIVRDYNRCETTVVDDFCSILDLPVSDQKDGASYDSDEGEYDAVALHLMLLINNCADPKKDGIRRRIARDLRNMHLSDVEGFVDSDTLARIERECASGNAWVAANFLNGVPLKK